MPNPAIKLPKSKSDIQLQGKWLLIGQEIRSEHRRDYAFIQSPWTVQSNPPLLSPQCTRRRVRSKKKQFDQEAVDVGPAPLSPDDNPSCLATRAAIKYASILPKPDRATLRPTYFPPFTFNGNPTLPDVRPTSFQSPVSNLPDVPVISTPPQPIVCNWSTPNSYDMESVCAAAPTTTSTNSITSAQATEPYRRASFTGQLPYVDTGTHVFDIDWYSLTDKFPRGKAERKSRSWRLKPRNKRWGAFSYSEDHATAIKTEKFQIPPDTSLLDENARVESPVMDTLEWIFIPLHELSEGDSGHVTPLLPDTTSVEEIDGWDWIPLEVSFPIDEPVYPESSVECMVHTEEDD
jgi:hypothetical protein